MLNEKLKLQFKNYPSKRILVTGANGMLGRAFVDSLRETLPQCEVRAFHHTKLDVSNRDQVLAHSDWLEDGWILHCACVVSVERCEQEKLLAEQVIAEGTENICELANQTNSKIYYPQSFLIYDGTVNPIDEQTPTNPRSHYSRLKLGAEQTVLTKVKGSVVTRMGGFFGGEEIDKNFVGKIYRHFLEQMRKGETRTPVGDRIWQPTYTRDLALNTLALLVNNHQGVYQMASHGEASFFDVAEVMVRDLCLEKYIKLEKVEAKEVSKKELGPRPSKAILFNRRLQDEGLDLQRPWSLTLSEYLKKPYFVKGVL